MTMITVIKLQNNFFFAPILEKKFSIRKSASFRWKRDPSQNDNSPRLFQGFHTQTRTCRRWWLPSWSGPRPPWLLPGTGARWVRDGPRGWRSSDLLSQLSNRVPPLGQSWTDHSKPKKKKSCWKMFVSLSSSDKRIHVEVTQGISSIRLNIVVFAADINISNRIEVFTNRFLNGFSFPRGRLFFCQNIFGTCAKSA